MQADWESDSPRLRENLAEVALLVQQTAERRDPPSLAAPKMWHRTMLKGLAIPDLSLLGTFRGEPGLEDAEVHIAGAFGVAATRVHSELRDFETQLTRQITKLDSQIAVAKLPSQAQLAEIFSLCAWVHAAWIRIHPFGNGNGRIARIWVNWIAMRYGLPPFLHLRPRPDAGYESAARQAMKGNWHPTLIVLSQLFTNYLAEL